MGERRESREITGGPGGVCTTFGKGSGCDKTDEDGGESTGDT